MQQYLVQYHTKDIENILKSPQRQIKFEILLDLTLLQNHNEKLLDRLQKNYDEQSIKWRQAIVNIQNDILKSDASFQKEGVKLNIEIKPSNHPKIDTNFKIFPDKNLFKLVAFRGKKLILIVLIIIIIKILL